MAHGAGHAGDGQVDRGGGDAITRPFQLPDQVGGLELVTVVLDFGLFGGQIDADFGDAVGALKTAFDIFDAHGAGHAGDREGDLVGGHGWSAIQLLISLRIFCISVTARPGSALISACSVYST